METVSSTISKSREFEGVVVSTGAINTIVVRVDHLRMHSKYKKQYKVSKRYAVDCRQQGVNIGDKVRFEECRPLSKTKRWRLVSKM